MSDLPSLTGGEVIRALERLGSLLLASGEATSDSSIVTADAPWCRFIGATTSTDNSCVQSFANAGSPGTTSWICSGSPPGVETALENGCAVEGA